MEDYGQLKWTVNIPVDSETQFGFAVFSPEPVEVFLNDPRSYEVKLEGRKEEV